MKLAGPQGNLAKAWAEIRKGVVMDDPEPAGRYLGCQHRVSRKTINGKTVKIMEYDMEVIV
jgi:hypothetical protein